MRSHHRPRAGLQTSVFIRAALRPGVSPLNSYTVRRQPARQATMAPPSASHARAGRSKDSESGSGALRSPRNQSVPAQRRSRVTPPGVGSGCSARDRVARVQRIPHVCAASAILKAIRSQRSQNASKHRCASETAARPRVPQLTFAPAAVVCCRATRFALSPNPSLQRTHPG